MLCLAAGTMVSAQAQMQRTILAEEFTQASCAPCASQNPGFHATLTANANRIVSIKYQTSWPGTDPMNAHNPAQVQTRVTYYGVTGVPNTLMDGLDKTSPSAGFTNAKINARYAIPSPFEVKVSHRISAANDSVYVRAVYKPLTTMTAPLKAHIAVVEREINFTTAPGTNGEKNFYSIMKRMLPGDQGTDIPVTAVGDSVVVSEAWKFANVYSINEIGVVSFVQNNTTKEVYQSALSQPKAVVADVAMASIAAASNLTCGNSVNMTANIKNAGPNPLTSCNIRATTATGIFTDFPWTGNLLTGQSIAVPVTVALPNAGSLNVELRILAANTGDTKVANDFAALTIVKTAAPTATLPVNNFTATLFPGNGFLINGNNNDAYNWKRSTVGYNGNAGSATLNWFNINSGNQDDMFLPVLNLSNTTTASLSFQVAYAQYATDNDNLRVRVSLDCGATWDYAFDKAGTDLATVAAQTASFTPTDSTQWREEIISLDSYIGQPNVLINFNGLSDYGNNLYVDKINLSGFVATKNADFAKFVNVFPSLTSGNVNANISLEKATDLTIAITNMLGQTVLRQTYNNTTGGNYNFNIANEAAGAYFVTVTTEGNTVTKKVILNK